MNQKTAQIIAVSNPNAFKFGIYACKRSKNKDQSVLNSSIFKTSSHNY